MGEHLRTGGSLSGSRPLMMAGSPDERHIRANPADPWGPADCPQPTEKPVGDKLVEVHNYLNEADEALAWIYSKLTGDDSARQKQCKGVQEEAQTPTGGIVDSVWSASTKAARLVGLARTICERL